MEVHSALDFTSQSFSCCGPPEGLGLVLFLTLVEIVGSEEDNDELLSGRDRLTAFLPVTLLE